MSTSTKTRTTVIAAALGCIALLGILGFRDPAIDPSIRYLAWKHGLVAIDLDRATSEMNLDVHRETLVIGKTRHQLDEQFGYTSSLEQATPYVRNCVLNSPNAKEEVIQIRQSDWVVVMQGRKAVQLLSVEGC